MSRCHSPNSCPYRPTVPELPDTSSGCMISVDAIAYPISRGYLRWAILISYDIMISWYESWFIYIQVTYICVHQFSSIFILISWYDPYRHGSTAASAASAPARAIAPNLCSSSRVPRLGACGSELPARIQPVEPTMPTDPKIPTPGLQKRHISDIFWCFDICCIFLNDVKWYV